MIDAAEVQRILLASFSHTPTRGQSLFFERFSQFVSTRESRVLILRGYAGTGKTSLLKAVCASMGHFRIQTLLLAPTGRAAQVMKQYTGRGAQTIHRCIYRTGEWGDRRPRFELKENPHKSTLFAVDEASMIGLERSESGRSLLEDLLEFCLSNGRCKLLLIGDPAQLPPVGSDLSPALDRETLRLRFGIESDCVELTEVQRQAAESGILLNATRIREAINAPGEAVLPKLKMRPDAVRLNEAWDVEETFERHFSQKTSDSLVVVRSNKKALGFNLGIRNRIRQRQGRIDAGDRLMVVRNNYFWLEKQQGFIANGDTLEVRRVKQEVERYGCSFALADVALDSPEGELSFEAWLLLDVLATEAPGMSVESMRRLYETALASYGELPMSARKARAAGDPFLQALHVKYAEAVTCHKAQGGQWDVVFVERPWLPEDRWTHSDLRWLYTALTRAREKVYLLGFESDLFE